MGYDDLLPHLLVEGGGLSRGVQRIEQFGQRNRGRARLAGVVVGTGVGDHQRVDGRGNGVEEQLPVLGADVALAGQRSARQCVVAVDDADPGEYGVVQSDQAHHPVRYRTHRHHGADGQRPGAEVSAGGSAGKVLTQ